MKWQLIPPVAVCGEVTLQRVPNSKQSMGTNLGGGKVSLEVALFKARPLTIACISGCM